MVRGALCLARGTRRRTRRHSSGSPRHCQSSENIRKELGKNCLCSLAILFDDLRLRSAIDQRSIGARFNFRGLLRDRGQYRKWRRLRFDGRSHALFCGLNSHARLGQNYDRDNQTWSSHFLQMKIKRWYHYVAEFFGVKTGPWYTVIYSKNQPIPPNLKFRIIEKDWSID